MRLKKKHELNSVKVNPKSSMTFQMLELAKAINESGVKVIFLSIEKDHRYLSD